VTTIPSFSAKDWIDTNCRGGHALRPESVAVISSFTLMWNIFEGAVCRTDANIRLLEEHAKEIAQRRLLLPDIECGVQFWRQRYVTGATFNNRFKRLFRPKEKKPREHVEAVLLSKQNDPESQLLAVMIVIYRLRNNLFHGLKQIDELNDQVQNLTMACRVLAAIVEVSWAHMIVSKEAA
jgi:hypothetical protein